MPNLRSEGQIMIGCWCEQAFVEKIDRARHSRTRSEFCRAAIAEKLRSMGIDVSEREAAAPDRAGKGGPRRVLYPIQAQSVELNETRSTRAPGKGLSRKKPARRLPPKTK